MMIAIQVIRCFIGTVCFPPATPLDGFSDLDLRDELH